MKKITIPSGVTGKELYSFLVANKKALIQEKKSMPIKFSDPFAASATIQSRLEMKAYAIKDGNMEETEDPNDSDVIRVTVIANTCNWMDSQSDVLVDNSAKRTIASNKQFMVHLSNHDYRIQSKVGEVYNVYLKNFTWKELGVNIPGSTQCIVFETDVYKSYDEKIFNQYRLKKINQHSIGLRYVDIELAINDPDYEKEIDFWNKYIESVGNKDAAIEQGYFWVVKEIQLLENSAVLFGSNILTPLLSVSDSGGKSDTADSAHSILDTHKDGSSLVVTDNDFDVSSLRGIKLFN